jgi:hypothetical protein
VNVGENRIANFLVKSITLILPTIVSIFTKRAIRVLLPGLLRTILSIRFDLPDDNGNIVQYHSEFLAKPVIDGTGLAARITVTSGPDQAVSEVRDDTENQEFLKTEQGARKVMDEMDKKWFKERLQKPRIMHASKMQKDDEEDGFVIDKLVEDFKF